MTWQPWTRPIVHRRQAPNRCICACLAMLLDIDLAWAFAGLIEVTDRAQGRPWPRDALAACRWMQPPAEDWELLNPPTANLLELAGTIEEGVPGEPFIAFVRLPRGKRSVGHAVLVRERILYDPEMTVPMPLTDRLDVVQLGRVHCVLMRSAAERRLNEKGPA